MDVRNKELSRDDERYGSHGKLANLAGDKHPSSLNKWRGDDPSDPRFFHIRRYLNALGLDFQIVPRGGTVARLTQDVSAGVEVTDETKQMVAIMENLPVEARRNLVSTAITYEKVWGSRSGPQEPDVGTGPTRIRLGNLGPADE